MGCSTSSVSPNHLRMRDSAGVHGKPKPLMIDQNVQKDDPDISPLATRHFTYFSNEDVVNLQDPNDSQQLEDIKKIGTLDFDNLDFSGQTHRETGKPQRPQLPNLEDLDDTIQGKHQTRGMAIQGAEPKHPVTRGGQITNMAELLDQSPKGGSQSSGSIDSARLGYRPANIPQLQLEGNRGVVGGRTSNGDAILFETSGSPSKYSAIAQMQEQDSANPIRLDQSKAYQLEDVSRLYRDISPQKGPYDSKFYEPDSREGLELSPIVEKPAQPPVKPKSGKPSSPYRAGNEPQNQFKSSTKPDLGVEMPPTRSQNSMKPRSYTTLPHGSILALPLNKTEDRFATAVMEALKKHLSTSKNELTPSRALHHHGLTRTGNRAQSVNPIKIVSHLVKAVRKNSGFASKELQMQASEAPPLRLESQDKATRPLSMAPTQLTTNNQVLGLRQHTGLETVEEIHSAAGNPEKKTDSHPSNINSPETSNRPLRTMKSESDEKKSPTLKDFKRRSNFRTIKGPSLLAELRNR